jgi:lysozyme
MKRDLSTFRRLSLAAGLVAGLLALAGCGGGGGPMPIFEHIDGEGGRAGAGNEHFTGMHPNQFPIHGIDVSKYQGDIDWQAVKRAGVKFAWIKATEGADHLDSKFRQNWEGARAAGVPRGAYHFVWWCRKPHEEINWFKQNVPVDPHALPPVLDVEATPTSKTCKRTLHREEVLRDMREMLVDMERHYRKKPVIYVTVDFYAAIMHPNEFSDYNVWVRSTKYAPDVPYPGRRWTFWQYQSDGRVDGVKGNIDKNAFYGTAEQWRAWLAGKR